MNSAIRTQVESFNSVVTAVRMDMAALRERLQAVVPETHGQGTLSGKRLGHLSVASRQSKAWIPPSGARLLLHHRTGALHGGPEIHARLECVTFSKDDLATPTRAVALAAGGAVALELAGLKDPVAEKAKLETKLAKLEKELDPLRTRRLSELRHQGPRSRRGQAREAQRRVNPTPPIRGAGEGTPVRTGPRNSPGTVVGEGRSMAVPSPSRPLLL